MLRTAFSSLFVAVTLLLTPHVSQAIPPQASFTMSIESGTRYAPVMVAFDGMSSNSWQNPFLHHEWDFGDGGVAYGPWPLHLYSQAGTYKVTLRVSNIFGESSSITQELKILLNVPPVALFDYELKTSLGDLDLVLDASKSYNTDGEVVSYTWDFGDGKTYQSSGPKTTHRYEKPGTYQVKLWVQNAIARINYLELVS